MRNPLAYLKHIVKDPVTTVVEADARKKELMPLLYTAAGILAVGLILQLALDWAFMVVFSLIGLAGLGFCGFLFFVANTAKKRFEALTCDKCHTLAEIKTPEDFAKYVAFTVEKHEATFNGYSGNKQPSNGVYTQVKYTASSSAVLAVALTCPHCGEVKRLTYYAEPFRCHAEAKNVGVKVFDSTRGALETAVRSAVDDYNDPTKRNQIPYTFQSSKNPNFENRFQFKGANGVGAHPDYNGARIDYHKDVEEMLEHYFVLNELVGTLSDPNAASKKKATAVAVPTEETASEAAQATVSQNVPEAVLDEATQKTPVVTADAAGQADSAPVQAVPAKISTAVYTTSVNEESPAAAVAEEHESATPVPSQSDPTVEDAKTAEEYSTDVPIANEPTAPKATYKKSQLIILIALCVLLLLIVAAIPLFIIGRGGESKPADTTPLVTTVPTTLTTTKAFNVNDYVGYWSIQDDQDKELTIHNGTPDSVTFSLQYQESIVINTASAQLQANTASFSLAVDGAIVKGTLTFLENAVTVQITQSTLAAMPVDTLEFTLLSMTSQMLGQNEEDHEEQEENNIPDSIPDNIPDNIPETVSYTIKIENERHMIYAAPSYNSSVVQELPLGTYTIVEEQTDAYGTRWGKLKSGLGWVCVSDIEADDTFTDDGPSDWAVAYMDYLYTLGDGYNAFSFVYVDGDEIPELHIASPVSTGSILCSYKNGSVVHCSGDGMYIPGEGLVFHEGGRMGYYYTDIYKLDDSGFTNLFSGTFEETFYTDENGNTQTLYNYHIGEYEVIEEDYRIAVENNFDSSLAVGFNGTSYDYTQILEELQKW